MTYRGHVRNGVVVLDDPTSLPEGVEVRLELVGANGPEIPDDGARASLFERLKPVIGAATGLPSDAASNVDHYLYGHPQP